MQATINDFFGSNFEQEVMDEVILLPFTVRNTNTGTITLPLDYTWEDFEAIDFFQGINEHSSVYATSTLDRVARAEQPDSWRICLSFGAQNTQNYRLDIVATSSRQATWTGSTSVAGQNVWPHHIIGHKRRIARVGLDELMSSMGLPNLVTNPDLNNPVNQRTFNGNWSSLAIGAYGYDQWIKVSNTHMGFVVEGGKYIPNKIHTLTVNNVVTKQVMSPASGHFVVAIPFATSGMYDFYAGEFKRPWHPPEDAMYLCRRYYNNTIGRTSFIQAHEGNPTVKIATRQLVPPMRVAPTCSAFVDGLGNASISTPETTIYDVKVVITNVGAGSVSSLNKVLSDASIPWSELNNKVITAA